MVAERLRRRDLEHNLCPGVRSVGMLSAGTTRRAEPPDQFFGGDREAVVYDYGTLRPRWMLPSVGHWETVLGWTRVISHGVWHFVVRRGQTGGKE